MSVQEVAIDKKIAIYRQEILRLRKAFKRLEKKVADLSPEKQAKYAQEFVDLSLDVERLESALRRINQATAEELNDLRTKIVVSLSQYNHWRKTMRDVEKLFLVNFVRPGYVLQQAVRQREYLEDAYQRLRQKIVEHQLGALSELEAEIRKVLSHAEHAFESDQRSFEDEAIKGKNLLEIAKNIDPQQIVEEYDEDRIEREFRRIVLPAVHPDTSDTPVETFLTVKEVFEEGDYLLMEAYTAQYRGEFEVDDTADPLEVEETYAEYQRDYHRLSGRLERKLNALKKELTPEELEDPEKVRNLLNEQRDEIRRLIQVETEKIFELREKIRDLVQLYLELNKESNDE